MNTVGREYGGEDQRGEVTAVPGSLPDLTAFRRRFERGDSLDGPVYCGKCGLRTPRRRPVAVALGVDTGYDLSCAAAC